MGGRRQPDGMSEANLQRFHPRRGVSKVDTNITMITSGASCRDAATLVFLEALIFNDLQNRAWKRGLKKAAFPRPRLNGI